MPSSFFDLRAELASASQSFGPWREEVGYAGAFEERISGGMGDVVLVEEAEGAMASVPSREGHLGPGTDLWRIISILWGVMR